MNYQRAEEIWKTTRKRKLQNNTYLEHESKYDDDSNDTGPYFLRLHSTRIIEWRHDGSIVLRSGGYETITTKARLNSYLEGWSVYSDRVGDHSGVWFVYPRLRKTALRERYYFADGIVLKPDGTIEPETEGDNIEKQIAERRAAAKEERDEHAAKAHRLKLDRGKRVEFTIVKKPKRYQEILETAPVAGQSIDFGEQLGELPTELAAEGLSFAVAKNPLEGSLVTRTIRPRYPNWERVSRTERTRNPEERWVVSETWSGASLSHGQTKAMALVEAFEKLKGRTAQEIKQAIAEFVGEEIEKFAKALRPRFYWDGQAFIDSKDKFLQVGWYQSDGEAVIAAVRTAGTENLSERFETADEAKRWIESHVWTRAAFGEERKSA